MKGEEDRGFFQKVMHPFSNGEPESVLEKGKQKGKSGVKSGFFNMLFIYLASGYQKVVEKGFDHSAEHVPVKEGHLDQDLWLWTLP